jgi:hypothetical protein
MPMRFRGEWAINLQSYAWRRGGAPRGGTMPQGIHGDPGRRRAYHTPRGAKRHGKHGVEWSPGSIGTAWSLRHPLMRMEYTTTITKVIWAGYAPLALLLDLLDESLHLRLVVGRISQPFPAGTGGGGHHHHGDLIWRDSSHRKLCTRIWDPTSTTRTSDDRSKGGFPGRKSDRTW